MATFAYLMLSCKGTPKMPTGGSTKAVDKSAYISLNGSQSETGLMGHRQRGSFRQVKRSRRFYTINKGIVAAPSSNSKKMSNNPFGHSSCEEYCPKLLSCPDFVRCSKLLAETH